jgi:alcohol dehydrogenase
MKALLFDGTLQYVDDYPVPEPAKGEALIRVSMAGICDTDIQITRGYLSFRGVPGHEFVGIVERVNGLGQQWVGKRVVGEINCGCGVCDWCRRGLERHCPHRTTFGILDRDGAFAEYLTLPVKNLHEVPENVSDEEAVFTEPLAAAFEITEQVHIKPTDRVLVMGDGKLGILCALVLKTTGADITLLGKHDEKLSVAVNLGLTQSFQLETQNSKLKTLFDIVVDATGSPQSFEVALQCVRPRGAVVLKTTVAQGKELNLSPLVINEVTVVGSRCGPFEPALRALASRTVDVKPLVATILPFSRVLEAFHMVNDGLFLKILLSFES